MRLFITPDLHGQKPKIYSKFDDIVCIGDFFGSKERDAIFKSLAHRNKTGENIPWHEFVGEKKAIKLLKQSEKVGINLIKYLLKKNKKPFFIIPGNADNHDENVLTWWEDFGKFNELHNAQRSYDKIVKEYALMDLHKKRIEFPKVIFVGYGISMNNELGRNPTKEQRKKYKKLFDEVAKHFDYAKKKKKPVIFFSHNMPYNTKMDKVSDEKSPAYGNHVGSKITLDIIKKYQPKICFGGHMHEYYGNFKIGKTLVVNVGYGSKKNTYLDIMLNKKFKVELWENKKIIKEVLV